MMCVGVLSTQICPLECGKLNMKSSIPTSAPKSMALKFFNYGNVMVLIVNKYGYAAKSMSSYFFVTPSIKS